MTTRTKTYRIDKLTVGDIVTLRFYKNASTVMYSDAPRVEDEKAVFVGIVGEGEERHAEFISSTSNGGFFRWAAYRMNKSWRYGSSAERLSVVEIQPFNGLNVK